MKRGHITPIVSGVLLLCICIVTVPAAAAVTIGAAGDHRFYLGEEIEFFGHNDQSVTYLFITGPGLPSNGARLNLEPKKSGVIDDDRESFSFRRADRDGSWSFRWKTSETMDLERGNYTVYATDQPVGFVNLSLSGANYSAIDIQLEWPFITVSVDRDIGYPGDTFSFHGIKEGAASPEEFVYIAVTNRTLGGSLPADGVHPEDFSIISETGNSATFARVWIEPDRTWRFVWNTSGLHLLNGSLYQFYIINKPLNISAAGSLTMSDMPAYYYTRVQIAMYSDPEVHSISPATGVNTGSISMVRIEGTGFQEGASVFIEPYKGPSIRAADVTVEGNTLTCTLDLTDREADRYNVVVVNPDGMSDSIDDGFEIIEPNLSGEVKAAVGILVRHLGDIRGRTLYAYPVLLDNPRISLWGTWPETVFLRGRGALIFVDEMPKANWEHPCRYFFVDTDGNIENADAYSPALNYLFTYAGGEVPVDPEGLWEPSDPDIWIPACIENCSNYWALLISGGNSKTVNHKRYWEDIAFMYTTLLDYGYDPDHITVLISDGPNTAADRRIGENIYDDSPHDLNGDGIQETILLANRTNLLAALDNLKNRLKPTDNLLVFTTAHGGWTGTANSSRLYLWNNEFISDTDFVSSIVSRFGSINSITMVMGQCYGGGFSNEFIVSANQKRMLITAANGMEPSWGSGFLNAWTMGMAGHDRFNPPRVDQGADLNRDKRITMSESYMYALAHDPFNGVEHPQLFAMPAGAEVISYLNDCSSTAARKITVTYPSSPGLTWNTGARYLITWRVEGLTGNVNIFVFRGSSKVYTVATAVPADRGEYQYVVTSLPESTYYKIRIYDATNSSIYDQSDNYFKITTGGGSGSVEFVTNPTGAGIACINESCACSPTTCRISDWTVGQHRVDVTKNGYYPRSYVVEARRDVVSTYIWTLDPIPTDINNIPEVPPYGGLDIVSSPTGATIWTRRSGASEWINQGETTALILLEPGDYQVKVTKSGYHDSEIRQEHIWTSYAGRAPKEMYFELEPLIVTPEIGDIAMAPAEAVVGVGESIRVSAVVSDPNGNYPLSALWEWGDGEETRIEGISGNAELSNVHAYDTAGTYRIVLYLTNSGGIAVSREAGSNLIVEPAQFPEIPHLVLLITSIALLLLIISIFLLKSNVVMEPGHQFLLVILILVIIVTVLLMVILVTLLHLY